MTYIDETQLSFAIAALGLVFAKALEHGDPEIRERLQESIRDVRGTLDSLDQPLASDSLYAFQASLHDSQFS